MKRDHLDHAIQLYFDQYTTTNRPVSVAHGLRLLRLLDPACRLSDDALEALLVIEALRFKLSVEFDRRAAA